MYKFKIIGSYEKKNKEVYFDKNLEIVYVPLLSESGAFRYGIAKSLEKMLDSGICPTEVSIDIMMFATLIYLSDIRISRNINSQDSWTREITIQLPVINSKLWNNTREHIIRMLNFLTGDKWDVIFEERKQNYNNYSKKTRVSNYDIVSLFSGGMDSLISTINYLEENKKVVLLSHAGEGLTKNIQSKILEVLKNKYSKNNIMHFDLWMTFHKNFIPNGYTDNTTRSRSFLFISFAIFAMSGIPKIKELNIPENGLIALNVPLDNLRIGSHSTRTTHPFYLTMWNELLNKLGVGITVKNPFWDKTKGEMAYDCKNKELLYKLIPISISCSSHGKARWDGLSPQHCGFCVPCLIRKSAVQKAFGSGKDETIYTKLSIKEMRNNHSKAIGIQLRSFELAINRIKEKPYIANSLIHKPGPLHNDYLFLTKLANVYIRGLLEIDEYIQENLKNEI